MLNTNIFDKNQKEELDEETKRQIRLRKEKKEKERLRKLSKVQGIYGVIDAKKKFVIKKSMQNTVKAVSPDSKDDKSTNDIFSRQNMREQMSMQHDRSVLSKLNASHSKTKQRSQDNKKRQPVKPTSLQKEETGKSIQQKLQRQLSKQLP